uniref:Uncharacterized protein n=1 Tax=Cucumis melo TaxID=3656 RepID=A0A9I9E1W1_CUCME
MREWGSIQEVKERKKGIGSAGETGKPPGSQDQLINPELACSQVFLFVPERLQARGKKERDRSGGLSERRKRGE